MERNMFIVNKAEMDYLSVSKEIVVDGKKMYEDLLRKIIYDDEYFAYTEKVFNGEEKEFVMGYLDHGDLAKSIKLNRAEIVKGLTALKEKTTLASTGKTKTRYEQLQSKTTFEQAAKDFEDKVYEVSVDNVKYEIPAKHFFEVAGMFEQQFVSICEDRDEEELYGIKKEHFLYAFCKFAKDNNISKNYVVPKEVAKKYALLKSQELIDIQALNKILQSDDDVKEFEISKELRDEILADMPVDANALEQAVYIYIKMCKTLSYDEEFFVLKQQGAPQKKHQDISYAATVTPEQNKVVCYDFTQIYAKFLQEIGFNYEIERQTLDYGMGHEYLKFRSGKYLISADAVTGVLEGDMIRAKLNLPLCGLDCENTNKRTKAEFVDSAERVYDNIRMRESMEDSSYDYFISKIEEYSVLTDSIKTISLSEKFSILKEKLKSSKLSGIDELGYILMLKRNLFSRYEQSRHFNMAILRKNSGKEEERKVNTTVVFTLNKYSIQQNPHDSKYYTYEKSQGFVETTHKELQERFDNNNFEYIYDNNPKIFGIIEKGK